MTLVEFTVTDLTKDKPNGHTVSINVEHIAVIEKCGDYAVVSTNHYTYHVLSSYKEVIEIIAKATQKEATYEP